MDILKMFRKFRVQMLMSHSQKSGFCSDTLYRTAASFFSSSGEGGGVVGKTDLFGVSPAIVPLVHTNMLKFWQRIMLTIL